MFSAEFNLGFGSSLSLNLSPGRLCVQDGELRLYPLEECINLEDVTVCKRFLLEQYILETVIILIVVISDSDKSIDSLA